MGKLTWQIWKAAVLRVAVMPKDFLSVRLIEQKLLEWLTFEKLICSVIFTAPRP